MRFLFSHNNADLYGASRSLLRLTSRLVKDGNTVSVILPYSGTLSDALTVAGVRCVFIPGLAVVERSVFKSLLGLVSFCFRLPVSVIRIISLIWKTNPDLVHSNTSVMLPSALAAKLCRVPHIWHIREFYSDFPSFWKAYQRVMAFCSSRVICVSASVQMQFDEILRAKTMVLHNGFPADEFQPVNPARIDMFRSTHNLTAAKLVGVIGRLKLRRKGQETFIKAACKVSADHLDTQFILIGSVFPGNESHEDDLRRLAASLGVTIVFAGDVNDIKAAYSALDVVVMSSGMPEPFGGVTIESMAFSKPVVGTNIGGTPEQILNGKTGILIPPNDPQAMANAISMLLDDEKLRVVMGVAGRKRFEQEFEFEPYYTRLMVAYNEVVQTKANDGEHPLQVSGAA
ncbi:MAG: glycosyltransferase family 4 protein [Kiritimatiellales bacterium]